MIVALPFPHKLLWPNGSEGNRHARGREKTKAKQWGWTAVKGSHCMEALSAPIPVALTIYPKRFGSVPDADNCVAAIKHYLDGIAQALGVNDRDFAAPTVTFGPREDRIEITIGSEAP